MPLPKGWNRVVATRRHLNEGAAGKTTIHRLDARREASIRRSQCGNSEAIVGVAVRANRLHLASKSAGQCEELWKETRIYIEIIETLKHTSAILQVSVEYCRSEVPHENLGVRVRLGNKRRSLLYYPSVGSHQGVFRWCCTSSIRLLTQPTIAESIRRFSFYATKLWVG